MNTKHTVHEAQEPALNKGAVSGWAYFRKHKTPILVGFAIGTTVSIVMNLIENIAVKIALIIYGG
jgi:hypothetical protein